MTLAIRTERRWRSYRLAPSEEALRTAIDIDRTSCIRGWLDHRRGRSLVMHVAGLVPETDHWGRTKYVRLCRTCRDYRDELRTWSDLQYVGLR